MSPTPEPLVTNWLSFEQLPETVYLYDFDGPISLGHAITQIKSARQPIVQFRRGFLTFCPPHDLQDHFGTSLPLKIVDQIGTNLFLNEAWLDQRIERFDAHNQFADLVRQAMESTFRNRMLRSYEMASGQQAWWGAFGSVPSQQIAFSYKPALAGRRQIIGYSKTRRLYWHYGITPKPRVSPFPHVRFVNRVLFTEDGQTPIDSPKRMHRLRRSFTKSWRNARWRDMLLAFLHWLSDREPRLLIPVGSETAFSLRLPPVSVDAPVSIALGDDTEDEPETEDDLVPVDDHFVDLDEREDSEESMDADDHDDR